MTDIARMSRRVVVVDDQPIMLEQVASNLGPHFRDMVTMTDPSECVRFLKAGEPYGVLLLDVRMEPFSGLQLLKLARYLDRQAPVIMMTASTSAEVAIGALKAGAVDFVIKPIKDWDGLARSINRAMTERQIRTQNERLVEELKESKADLDRALDLMRHLNVTTQRMHASRDAAEILNMLVRTASDCLAAKRVSIMINDPSSDEMVIQAAVGVAEKARGERVKPWQGVAGAVLAQRVPIVVNAGSDMQPVPRNSDREARYGKQSYMSIPIILARADQDDQVMGVMNITDRDQDRAFSASEIEFATHLARQAAFALAGAAVWAQLGRIPNRH